MLCMRRVREITNHVLKQPVRHDPASRIRLFSQLAACQHAEHVTDISDHGTDSGQVAAPLSRIVSGVASCGC